MSRFAPRHGIGVNCAGARGDGAHHAVRRMACVIALGGAHRVEELADLLLRAGAVAGE